MALRDLAPDARGVPYKRWRLDDISRQAKAYLATQSKAEMPALGGVVPGWVTRRQQGETVLIDDHQWLWQFKGISESTWAQLRQLAKERHRVVVIRWRDGKSEIIFRTGEWK